MRKKHRKLKSESPACYIVMALLAIICLLPLLMILSASLTDEVYVQKNGYSLLPMHPSLDTYIFLIANKGEMLAKAFLTTISVVILGTLYAVTITTFFAYAISQKKSTFRFARPLSFFAWFTTIFSGGVLPWYIMCTQYYGLKNNLFALFIPSGINVWNMFILRGNFREVPEELIESAKLDGASDAKVFVRISIPLARAGIVTVALFNILSFWNDFFLPQWLITDSKYTTVQKMLYSMLSNVATLLNSSSSTATMALLEHITLPANTAKMAVTVLAVLPIVALYPFALKYFVKGINLGGIKG